MSGQGPRYAWLTGEYPKVSHTFIGREIAALRAQGVDILTCTIRRTAAREVMADQRAEEAQTFAVIETLTELGIAATAARLRPWLDRVGQRFNQVCGGLFMLIGAALPLRG